MTAADFSLPDDHKKLHTLAAYRGRWVVLIFYPTLTHPETAMEIKGLEDKLYEFTTQSFVIVGISQDPPEITREFRHQYHIHMPLLTDPTGDTIRTYEAWAPQLYLARKISDVKTKSVIIDPQGEIRKTYETVNPLTHAETLLTDLSWFKNLPPVTKPEAPISG